MLRTAALAAALLATSASGAAPPHPGALDLAEVDRAIQAQDWPRLERLAREATAAEPGDPERWLYLGVALVNQGKDGEGEKALRRGIAARPTAALHHRLGQVLLRRGKAAEAEKEFRRALRLAEGDRLLADLASAQVAQGKDAEAEKSLDRARQLSPDPRAFEDVQTAIAARRVLATVPLRARKLLASAESAAAERRWADAEEALRQLVKVAPELGTAHLELGLVVLRRGAGAEAEGHLRIAAARLKPYQVRLRADAYATLAETLLALGRKDGEARAWLEQAVALRGERPEYLATLARACEADGDRAGALEAWQRVVAHGASPPALRDQAAARVKALQP